MRNSAGTPEEFQLRFGQRLSHQHSERLNGLHRCRRPLLDEVCARDNAQQLT